MKFREHLRRAIARMPEKKKKEIAARAGITPSTLSDILSGKTESPSVDVAERLIDALDMTHSEFFDEPHLRLAPEDVELGRRFHAMLGRLLESDASLKEVTLSSRIASPPESGASGVLSNRARKAQALQASDVVPLKNEPIPAEYQIGGIIRAFRVQTDAMVPEGILIGSTIYVHRTRHEDAADGQLIVCEFRSGYLLRQLDLSSGALTLRSGNRHYDPIEVDRKLDQFALVGIVIRR
jgi:transcriptional regulator with XRE-family HTH domain